MKITRPHKDRIPTITQTGRLPTGPTQRGYRLFAALFFFALLSFFPGCAGLVKNGPENEMPLLFNNGTILNTRTGSSLSYTDLIAELETVQIIYVGEQHTDPAHHAIQLNIIKDIFTQNPHMMVGMEMFDRSYQPVLDQWTSGKLDYQTFLKRTHWYANWQMDDQLYADILGYLKEKNIRLIGLNIPFHIPSKIAIGGIDSLFGCEKKMLPDHIDTSNTGHRQYVKEIFEQHTVRGIDDFENFYAAQCVWEDTMAQTIAAHLKKNKMIVIAGNGHIIKKFGIPDRAYRRTGASFRTLYLAPEGTTVVPSFADYIWITPAKENKRQK